jgi:hypothetical protein
MIAVLAYLPNLLICYFFYYTSNKNAIDIAKRVVILKIYKGAVQPFLMFFLPGYLYYKACIYIQDE